MTKEIERVLKHALIKGFYAMAAINYNFIPAPVATIQGEHKLPRHITPIFIYILGRMRIPGWKLHKADICKQCEISMPTLQRALKWLVANGYMAYDLINKWQVFPTPITPQQKTTAKTNADKKPSIGAACSPSPITNDSPSSITSDSPYIEVSFNKIEEQQPEPVRNIVTAEPVVVSLSDDKELVYPELTPKQKTAVKAIAKQLKEPAMTQELLFTLAYAITQGHIKSSLPGYFRRLVDAANEGRYTATNAAGATKPDNPNIAKTQAQLEVYRTVNKTERSKAAGFFASMRSAVGASR